MPERVKPAAALAAQLGIDDPIDILRVAAKAVVEWVGRDGTRASFAHAVESGRQDGKKPRRSVIDKIAAKRPIDERPVWQGRKSTLTTELLDAIVEALRDGCTQKEAAAIGGISQGSYQNWKARGEAYRVHLENGGKRQGDEERYLEFLASTQLAQAMTVREFTVEGRKVAFGEAVASRTSYRRHDGIEVETVSYAHPSATLIKFFLSHLSPDGYGDRLELSGPGGGPIAVETQASARESIEDLLDRISSRADEAPSSKPAKKRRVA